MQKVAECLLKALNSSWNICVPNKVANYGKGHLNVEMATCKITFLKSIYKPLLV